MEDLLDDVSLKIFSAIIVLNTLKAMVYSQERHNDVYLGKFAKAHRTFYKSHTLDFAIERLSQVEAGLYSRQGQPRKRIVCVKEKKIWGGSDPKQVDYRAMCGPLAPLKPAFLPDNLQELVICPQFWHYPHKPMVNNTDCPTVNNQRTRFNSGPVADKLIIYQSYFLMAGADAYAIAPTGFNLMPSLLPYETNPNFCFDRPDYTTFNCVFCDLFFVASKYCHQKLPVINRPKASFTKSTCTLTRSYVY